MNQNTDPRVAEAIRLMKEDSGRWNNVISYNNFNARSDAEITREEIEKLINGYPPPLKPVLIKRLHYILYSGLPDLAEGINRLTFGSGGRKTRNNKSKRQNKKSKSRRIKSKSSRRSRS